MSEENQLQFENEEQDINELIRIRREKLKDLQGKGKDPFKLVKYEVTHHSKDIHENFDELEGQTVSGLAVLWLKG